MLALASFAGRHRTRIVPWATRIVTAALAIAYRAASSPRRHLCALRIVSLRLLDSVLASSFCIEGASRARTPRIIVAARIVHHCAHEHRRGRRRGAARLLAKTTGVLSPCSICALWPGHRGAAERRDVSLHSARHRATRIIVDQCRKRRRASKARARRLSSGIAAGSARA